MCTLAPRLAAKAPIACSASRMASYRTGGPVDRVLMPVWPIIFASMSEEESSIKNLLPNWCAPYAPYMSEQASELRCSSFAGSEGRRGGNQRAAMRAASADAPWPKCARTAATFAKSAGIVIGSTRTATPQRLLSAVIQG